jgi:hypothetical protein
MTNLKLRKMFRNSLKSVAKSLFLLLNLTKKEIKKKKLSVY